MITCPYSKIEINKSLLGERTIDFTVFKKHETLSFYSLGTILWSSLYCQHLDTLFDLWWVSYNSFMKK